MDISWTQINSWLDCGERFRLERVAKAPVVPAWYLVGGKAVHSVTEAIDIDNYNIDPDHPSIRPLWLALFEEEVVREEERDQTGTPSSRWRTSKGRGEDWWIENGLRMVTNWIRFRQRAGWRLYADDPSIGVELYVDGYYGQDMHRMRGWVDRVMMTADGEPFVLDLKTGDTVPKTAMQLALYADMLRRGPWGVEIDRGCFYLTGKDEATPMLPLAVDKALIDSYVDGLAHDRIAGSYHPRPGIFCSTCPVRDGCSAKDLLYLPPPKRGRKPLQPIGGAA